MNKKLSQIYNFGAGPACLPQEVLAQIRHDIPDWYQGISVMELSHRLPVVTALTQSVETDLRQLLAIPSEFAVLFMHGGARAQFAAIPLNLLDEARVADYLISGTWSALACKEAQKYGQINCVATSQEENYRRLPPRADWKIDKHASYFHYTDNETIHGIEFAHPPVVADKWLVSDMTSNLMTKPIDFTRFGLIYASAQKNLGIAGLTVVIVRKALLGKAHPWTPATLNYSEYYHSHSLYNTPAVFCWYVLGLILKWAKAQGGLEVLAQHCQQKAALLYQVIDNSDFYQPYTHFDRSRINIPFRLPSVELETLFLEKADSMGLKQLKGHQLLGGCRASLYNAMPIAGVQQLVEFMQFFQKRYG